MSRLLRLGAVSYLNARPLVHGLEHDGTVSIRFDLPSVCADELASGDIDLGLVPSITYLNRAGDHIVPGVMIGSVGPVASVALFARRPLREVRTIALDTSSRTSAALTRILCARKFEIAPTFVPHAPDLGAMLASADAALLIGDPALFVDATAFGAGKIDLGAAWTDLTGLPFVWAFWVGASDAADAGTVALLQQACASGLRSRDAIADAYCAAEPARQALARTYLRDNITYALDAPAIEGLRTYYQEACALGLVDRDGPVAFFS